MSNSDDDVLRQAARQALEGPEHEAWRQQTEKGQALKDEQAAGEKRLAEISKQKEELELGWIDLDNQRQARRTVLKPILEAEKTVETEEGALETEEAKIGLVADKHLVEEKRWAVGAKRQALERQRWLEEEKVIKLEQVIEVHTAKYRGLLDEEDKLRARLEQIKNELGRT